jgi:cytochrome P450
MELAGRPIRKGDTLVLFYPSAGRDEAVFANPEELDIARSPNPHVSFGIGEHYCLGASLAKLELECIFRELSQRVEHIDLAGPIERLRASVIGGVKRMPVRIALA